MRTYSVEKAREEGGDLEKARMKGVAAAHLASSTGGFVDGIDGELLSAGSGEGSSMASSSLPASMLQFLPRPAPSPSEDLSRRAEELGIKYFLVSYAPLNSDSRVSVVPRRAIGEVQRNGCGVPAAMFFHADGADPEMYVVPDPASLVQLPWKPEYGWLSSNLYMRGRPFSQCSRTALRRQIHEAAKLGYQLKAGVEPEFFLLNKEGTALGDVRDTQQPMSLQEPLAVMRTAPVMQRVCDYMEQLGWEPYEIDHEASCCQYEINFAYVDALKMADRYCFMKFMIKEIAELEGYQATFMPVPVPKLVCANGLHVNVSLWHLDGDTNAFPAPSRPTDISGSQGQQEVKDGPSGAGQRSHMEEPAVTQVAKHFIGGMLRHAEASCAVMCPTINSYKRLNMGSWCPTTVCWGGNNRTVLLRVPAPNRVEHRLPDGATNLYLSLAIILASGLDGVRNKIDPGPAVDVLVNQHPDYKKFKKMPQNLLDAMRALKKDSYMLQSLGPDLVHGFTSLKEREWDQFMSNITDWERTYYLNC